MKLLVIVTLMSVFLSNAHATKTGPECEKCPTGQPVVNIPEPRGVR